jgi:hypothetical protein
MSCDGCQFIFIRFYIRPFRIVDVRLQASGLAPGTRAELSRLDKWRTGALALSLTSAPVTDGAAFYLCLSQLSPMDHVRCHHQNSLFRPSMIQVVESR